MSSASQRRSAARGSEPEGLLSLSLSHLVLGFQRDGINHTDVVGLRGGKVVVSVFDEVAGAVVSEVGHGVVEKGNGPERKWVSSSKYQQSSNNYKIIHRCLHSS